MIEERKQFIKEIDNILARLPVWHYYSPQTAEVSFKNINKIRSILEDIRDEQVK